MTAYYYECGSVQGEADDPWAIVAEAVEDAADAGRLQLRDRWEAS